MFAAKSRVEIMYRVFLIGAILLDALVPSVSYAMSLPTQDQDVSSPVSNANLPGSKGFAIKHSALFPYTSRVLQAGATAVPTVTAADTPVPQSTVAINAATPTIATTSTPSPTVDNAATVTSTPDLSAIATGLPSVE